MTIRRAIGAMLVSAGLAVGLAGAEPKGAAPQSPAVEASGTIPGVSVARPGGGFLGLQVVGSNFVLSFYDAKKQPVPVDVARATARWPVRYQPNDERTVLTPTPEGNALRSPLTVRPPHAFKVWLSLFVAGSDAAVENHAVDYR